jgi:late competence protein required for DNA uptake (superfamily II DNA/RNA helicase)
MAPTFDVCIRVPDRWDEDIEECSIYILHMEASSLELALHTYSYWLAS